MERLDNVGLNLATASSAHEAVLALLHFNADLAIYKKGGERGVLVFVSPERGMMSDLETKLGWRRKPETDVEGVWPFFFFNTDERHILRELEILGRIRGALKRIEQEKFESQQPAAESKPISVADQQ